VRRQDCLRELGAPVSEWLLDALQLHPGERVLELAAGLGETGMLAAELVAPIGGVIVSDQAEAMLEGARARAAALGLSNVEFQVLGAEWIDLPVASVDAVICRFGYMLMADPRAALAETRRVLRPHGRLALAVWDAIERNPWAGAPTAELRERGLLAPAPSPGEFRPGPFALASAERLRALLEDAGFGPVRIEVMDVCRRHRDFEEMWEATLDLSRTFHDAVLARPREEIAEIKRALAGRVQPFTAPDGSLALPGRALLSLASA
jgi:SAM-dependent methyltransferase